MQQFADGAHADRPPFFAEQSLDRPSTLRAADRRTCAYETTRRAAGAGSVASVSALREIAGWAGREALESLVSLVVAVLLVAVCVGGGVALGNALAGATGVLVGLLVGVTLTLVAAFALVARRRGR